MCDLGNNDQAAECLATVSFNGWFQSDIQQQQQQKQSSIAAFALINECRTFLWAVDVLVERFG